MLCAATNLVVVLDSFEGNLVSRIYTSVNALLISVRFYRSIHSHLLSTLMVSTLMLLGVRMAVILPRRLKKVMFLCGMRSSRARKYRF